MHMNAFMYSVLEECVKTDAGVEIVRSYQDIMDAQGAWAALGRRYLDSPAARLGVTRLTREIQDLRVSNSHTGSIEAFITDFTQKVTDRDNMVPAHQRFSDSVKIEMLHDACYGHRDLQSVRTQIDCLQLTSGRILTYHEITQLYKVTAAPLTTRNSGHRLIDTRIYMTFMTTRDNRITKINAMTSTLLSHIQTDHSSNVRCAFPRILGIPYPLPTKRIGIPYRTKRKILSSSLKPPKSLRLNLIKLITRRHTTHPTLRGQMTMTPLTIRKTTFPTCP
jgi:hypothetical protein